MDASCPGTIIFLDVDGVLNVGIKDPNGRPALDLSTINAQRARDSWNIRQSLKPSDRLCVERLVEVQDHQVGYGDGTYGDFISDAKTQLCSVFVERLAQLIQTSTRPLVVLSSTWRMPSMTAQVQNLEDRLSGLLQKPFKFGARTPLMKDNTPPARLQMIGDYLEQHMTQAAAKKVAFLGETRILVLEDFHVTPFCGWRCGSSVVDSAEAAEGYLMQRVKLALARSHGPDAMPQVRVVHTYDSWSSPFSDQKVEVASGLTMKHFTTAIQFVKGTGEDAEKEKNEEGAAPRIFRVPGTGTNVLRQCAKSFSMCGMPKAPKVVNSKVRAVMA